MELPNPDVKDVQIRLDVIPNLVVVYDLDVEEMLGKVLHVDAIQHLKMKSSLSKMTLRNFLVELLDDDVDDLL